MRQNTHMHLRSVVLLVGLSLVFAWAGTARAEEVSQMTIAPTGQVMVRGASVVSVDGYTITAQTSWGAAKLTWVLRTTGSTQFVPRLSSATVLKAIKPGDSVAFSGTLDTGESALSVDVSFLRDSSLVDEDAVVNGQVTAVLPDEGIFVLDTDSGTTTVSVSSGTILTRGGNTTALGDISVGDTVRAWGSLNTVTRVLDADRASFSVETVSTAGGGGGFFSNILAWIEGSRGLLSVRDR